MERIVRVRKTDRKRQESEISRNEGVQGTTIEVMMERIREGEGEESILDRDLVYNDGETGEVNPVTDIRSDKFDLMISEKEGEREYKKAKMKVVKDEEPKLEDTGTEGEE